MKGITLKTPMTVFVSVVSLMIAFFALLYLGQFVAGAVDGILGILIIAVLSGALFVGAFKLSEMIAPKPEAPENLKIGDIELNFKEIWKSKTFWLSILLLAVQIFNMAAGSEVLDQSFIDSIAALDWEQWLTSILALVMIIVRKFFTGSGIK